MSYKVQRTSKRKGKTHKVTNTKTGEVRYFGDPNLKNKPGTKAAKNAKARHKKNLDRNPFFRAYWNATWQDGGSYNPEFLDELYNTEYINTTGYTKGSSTEHNDYNIIPGGNITMKNVGKNLIAVKLDKFGKPIGMEFMKQGKDYEFDDTYSVLEIPQYQYGGSNTLGSFPYINPPVDTSLEGVPIPPFISPNQLPNNTIPKEGLLSTLEPKSFAPMGGLTMGNIDTSVLGVDPNLQTSSDEFPNNTRPKVEPLSNLEAKGFAPMGGLTADDIDTSALGVDPNLQTSSNEEVKVEGFKQDKFPNIQFFNPYGGVDIPTAATTLGQGIANKDALGIVGSSVKLAAGLGRNIVGGLASQKRTNRTMQEYYRKLREDGNVTDLEEGGKLTLKEGGKMTDEQFLTGEYITGIDENSKLYGATNAEIEKGEYFKTVEGDVAEVVGNTHNQGGENVVMAPGDRVLTDHTKLGASNAKYIRDNYDIDVRAKNTYSDVLDKFRSKSGLKKLLKEEEDILSKMENQNDVKDTKTKDLNTKFLQDKLKDLSNKKEPIEEARKSLYDKLYELQEKDKPASERDNNFQEGGVFVDSGAREYSEDEQKRVQEFYSRFLDEKGMKALTDAMKAGTLRLNERQIFGDDITTDLRNVGKQSQTGIRDTFGYQNQNTIEGFLLNDYYQQIVGKPFDPSDREAVGKIQEIYNQAVQQRGFDFDFDPTTDKLIDEKFGNRTASMFQIDEALQANKAGTIDLSKLKELGPEKGDELLKEYGITYDQAIANYSPTTRFLNLLPKDDGTSGTTTVSKKPLPETDPKPDVDGGVTENEKLLRSMLLLPDQYPMVPEGTQPVLKNTRRYDRVSPAVIDPIPYLQQVDRQRQVSERQTEGLTPSVRAAALANIEANTQKALSDAMLNIDRTNIQSINNAEITNARIQGREEDARLQDLLSFEQRQLLSDSKTDYALQEYFDKIQQVNLGNFQTVNEINNANARSSNVQFTGDGYIVKPFDKDKMQQMLDYYYNMSQVGNVDNKNNN